MKRFKKTLILAIVVFSICSQVDAAKRIWRIGFAIPLSYDYSATAELPQQDVEITSEGSPYGFAVTLEAFRGFNIGYEYYTQNIKYDEFIVPSSELIQSFFLLSYTYYAKKFKYSVGLSAGNSSLKFTDEQVDYEGSGSTNKLNLKVGYRFDTALDFFLGFDSVLDHTIKAKEKGTSNEFDVKGSGSMFHFGAVYGF